MKSKNMKKVALAMAISTSVLVQSNGISLADSLNTTANVENYSNENKSNPKNYKEAKENYDEAKKGYDLASENLDESQKAYDKVNETNKNLESKKEVSEGNLQETNNKLETAVEDNTKIQEKNVEEKSSKLNNQEKELENAEKSAQKSEETVNEKTQEKDTAKKNLDAEKEKNPDAEEKIKAAENNLSEADNNKNKAESDYKEKTKALEEKNKDLENLNNFEKDNKKLEEKVKENDSKISTLEKDKANKENSLNKLNSEKENLKSQLDSRQKELEQLQKQAKNSVTEKQKAEALKQWNEGSVGFFRKNGSQQAIDVFTKLPNRNVDKEKSRIYLEANKKYNTNDSRKLENMLKSIDALRKVNAKRQSNNGYNGYKERKLNILRISDYDMAVAQANANFTRVMLNKYGENYDKVHANIHPQMENLTWEDLADDPDGSIEFWWDNEKKLFDKYKKIINTNINDLDDKVKAEKKDPDATIWHYATMIDLGYTFVDQNPTKSAGYAIGQGVASSVFNKQANQITYSIDEYEDKLRNYIDDLKSKINAETIQDKDLLQKIQNVQNTIKDLENKLKAKQAEISKVKSNINNLNKKIDPLSKENAKDKEKLKENKKRLDNIDKEKEDLKNQIEEKSKEKETSLDNLNISKANYKKAKENLDSTNKQFKSYKIALDNFEKAQNELSQAKKELKENNQKIAELENQIVNTKEELEKAKDLYEKSKSVDLNDPESYKEFDYIKNLLADKEKYEKELLSLEDKLKDAKEKALSSSKDLEEAKAVYAKALDNYIDAKDKLDKFKKEEEAKYVVLQTPKKQGYKFLYWRYGNKIYYPGQKLKLDKNIKLEAVWKEIKPSRLANKVDKSYSENPNTSVNSSLAPMLIGLMSTFATAILKKKEK